MSQTQGKIAEDLALNYLISQGLRLLNRNFRSKFGEIDLIMQDHSHIVFVEVRFRKSNAFGSSLETINYMKQQKIIKTAQIYLLQNKCFQQSAYRFDAIGISKKSTGQGSRKMQHDMSYKNRTGLMQQETIRVSSKPNPKDFSFEWIPNAFEVQYDN